ncbi:GrpB family protein [Paenibacillus kobensis]|uniref:GrpB family protein n=1 Tax=Paenibacillus kobensis TaxID=59841 RepID=UPI000FDA03D7|nr:GrpB family protein [Paenibacillus kobensis]
MEIVNFYDHSMLYDKAQKLFVEQRARIKQVVSEADIQHVGSTAIPGTLTKGDLDIQVRVMQENFMIAVRALSTLYLDNEGSIQTGTFRAFKDDSTDPPLGIQLTVKGSDFDFFYKFRDVLLINEEYRIKYDELKRSYEGKGMEVYREAKNEFFEWLMETPEFRSL